MLQAQFSLLYNESLQVKTQLDEARGLLLATKNSHLRHIEHMEVRPWNRPQGQGIAGLHRPCVLPGVPWNKFFISHGGLRQGGRGEKFARELRGCVGP